MLNLTFLANGLILAGAATLVASLFRVGSLVEILPEGKMQQRWRILSGLISFFAFGYICQVIIFWNIYTDWSWMIVPAILFCGGCFVWTSCALVLQTTLDLKKVLRKNDIDPLTQIYNRGYLDHRLMVEVSRAQRQDMPLSVLMIDIDHFKSINDTYGHQVGDHILVEFGKLTQGVTRCTDVVARYGGEEFLVLAPGTDAQAACRLADRIREKTAEHPFAVSQEEGEAMTVNVTVSVGIAQYSDFVNDQEKLVPVADDALYRAKDEGRNCVVVGDVQYLAA